MNYREYDGDLAAALAQFSKVVREAETRRQEFRTDPTKSATEFLLSSDLTVPEMFHAHAIRIGDSLPSEPKRATIDRYIYIYRASGLFEFKIVPGSPSGDDSIMITPTGACCCCNCCVIELPM